MTNEKVKKKKGNTTVPGTMRVNLSRKDLSQRRKGAEFLRKFLVFLCALASLREEIGD
jgi:hypothetical protein